jgi:predicted TIM-barrel fold metal-dependent hydrolase
VIANPGVVRLDRRRSKTTEDDVDEVVSLMGADRVIFGSDWPHIEGMPQPLDYLQDVAHFDDATKRRILRENTAELNQLRPA